MAEREVRGGMRGGEIGGAQRVDGGWQRERLEGGGGGEDRWGESGWRVAEREVRGGRRGGDRWGESGWRVAEREVRGGRRGGR